MTLGLLALWTLIHSYRGLTNDGVLYVLQASARLHPYLTTDVVFSGTSQDSYTLFPPLYAALIQALGIIGASTILFAFCTTSHFLAAWLLVRRLFDSHSAYLAVAMLICVPSEYGPASLFHCAEDFLTARSLAEACVVASIAAYYWRRTWVAAGLIGIGMLIHPVMTLPGLLLLLCLIVPTRVAVIGAAAALAGVVLTSWAAMHGFAPLASFKPMDPAWLEVVEERSDFLFLKNWYWVDWEVQLRPLLSLVVALVIIEDPKIRKLCGAAGLVGLSGLALAAIPDVIGPIPILLQGQAWRWVWIACTVAACMVAPSALLAWRTGGWGRLCAALLIMGWVFPPIDGEIAFAGAGLAWAARWHIRGSRRVFNFVAYAVFGIIAAWTVGDLWLLVDNMVLHTKGTLDPIAFTRWTFALAPLSLACAWLLYPLLRRFRFAPLIASGSLAALVICFLPTSLLEVPGFDDIRHRDQYKNWREAIPESSSVLVLSPPPVFATFPWLTLERTSYTSSSQSAGVVFSEKTAAEIRRRSEVLKPVMPPDWRILSQFRRPSREKPTGALTPPSLTAQSLKEICKDVQLGFVVSKDDVGFSPMRHTEGGDYQDWNLYDCRRVRATKSDAT